MWSSGLWKVGVDETHLFGQITLAHYFQRLDLDRTGVLRIPLRARAGPPRPVEAHLSHKRGSGLKGIQVEVEREGVERTPGQVSVGEGLRGVDGPFGDIQPCVDLVGYDALRREWLFSAVGGRRRGGRLSLISRGHEHEGQSDCHPN